MIKKLKQTIVKLIAASLLVSALLVAPGVAIAETDNTARAKLAVGTGGATEEVPAFETHVKVNSGGQLSEANYREVSRLASRLMFHLGEGAYEAAADSSSTALKEVQQARKLASLIRSVLPTSSVETVVKDRNGQVVYSDTREEQDDLIPVFRGSIKVNVVQPLLEIQRTDAKIKGVSLADADLINTSLWVDLPYVELKLKRAESLLSKGKTEEAAAELALARLEGVDIVAKVNRSPLVRGIEALALAEEMGEQGFKEAAIENLKRASVELELYRTTRKGQADEHEIKDLLVKMETLKKQFEDPGWTDKIKSASRKMFSFFRTNAEESKADSQEEQSS